jgi:DNA-3-methyladenine glycosylase
MHKHKVLNHSFFNRPVLEVAHDLIGKFIIRELPDGKKISLMINETEAYDGPCDKASHARFGKTERNKVMFGPAGHFYVYLVYGMHWMLNIVTDKVGLPSGVLLRGAGNIVGPANLTKYLKVDGKFYGLEAKPENKLWFEDRGIKIPESKILKTPRIGIDYSGECSKKLYRFIIKI